MNYFKKMVGEHFFVFSREMMDNFSIVLPNANEEMKTYIMNYAGKCITEEKSFIQAYNDYVLELKIIEIQYNILPHEILHITFNNVMHNYNTLTRDLRSFTCHIENFNYAFKTTMIYNFTNYNKYVCKSKPSDKLTNICVMFDDNCGDDKVYMGLSKCLIDNMDGIYENVPHKNIIVYTSDDKILNGAVFDETVVYRRHR